MSKYERALEDLKKGKHLDASLTIEICSKAKKIFFNCSNILELRAPVTLVGDVHGQLNDVFELFAVGGWPPFTNYLFLGDYVDRGHFSLETITLILLLKIMYPSRISAIRGNHESRHINQIYGFYEECHKKFPEHMSSKIFNAFNECFDSLPLAATVEGSVFCTHGGLSPLLRTLGNKHPPFLSPFPPFPKRNSHAQTKLWF